MRAFEIQIAEGSLRNTYNTIWRRRNPSGARFFEVYSKKPKAKEHFKLLAEKLLKKKIDPRTYMTVMCSYGRYASSQYLPPTSWLRKNSTIEEIYQKWLHEKEMKKHGQDREILEHHLAGDSEIFEEEILGRLKQDKKALAELCMHDEAYIGQKPHWNKFLPMVLLPQFVGGTVSGWYIVLRRDFLDSEQMGYLSKSNTKQLKECKRFYKSNPRVWKKAKLFLRGER